MGTLLSDSTIPPFFPQQLSPVLPQFPFSFFPWPSARFEPTLLFSSGVPVCLPYHDYLLRFTGLKKDIFLYVQVQIYIKIQLKHEVMYIIQAFACNISRKKCINAGNKNHAHFRNALPLHVFQLAMAHQLNFLKLSKILADHE